MMFSSRSQPVSSAWRNFGAGGRGWGAGAAAVHKTGPERAGIREDGSVAPAVDEMGDWGRERTQIMAERPKQCGDLSGSYRRDQ